MAYTETALYTDSAQHANVAMWTASTAYTIGQIVRQRAAPSVNNERCFVCTTAGTSLASEPSWSLTRGSATTEAAGPRWHECTGRPALNADASNTNSWTASQGTIAVGMVIKNTAATHYFICTTGGTGGTGAEPSWNTTTGATTVDNGATWMCLGAVGSFTVKFGAACARLRLPLNNSSNWLLNANMTVFVGDDHAETNSSGTQTFAAASSCQIICIDHTAALPAGTSDLRATASLTESGGGQTFLNSNSIYVYGLQVICAVAGATSLEIAKGGNRMRFEQCVFSLTAGTASSAIALGDSNATGTVLEFKDCSFHFQVAGQYLIGRGCPIKWENCALTGTLPTTTPIFAGGAFVNWIIEACDLSNVTSGAPLVGIGGSNNPNGYWAFKDCKVPASFLPYTTSDANIRDTVTIDLIRCDSGAINYRNERHMRYGGQTTSIAVVRTTGASDGTTAISHKIDTTTNARSDYSIFNAFTLATWNDTTGANVNVTLYGIANDTRVPNNDEVWFDVEYLGSASSPEGDYKRGGKATLGSASALTADTSDWDDAATARANSTAYVLGDVRKVASNPGRLFICTTAGTSAGSEPGGYASAVDGGSVTDGSAVFRAACRFKQTLTLSSPQPGQKGYLYAYPKLGRASMTYYLDPKIELS